MKKTFCDICGEESPGYKTGTIEMKLLGMSGIYDDICLECYRKISDFIFALKHNGKLEKNCMESGQNNGTL